MSGGKGGCESANILENRYLTLKTERRKNANKSQLSIRKSEGKVNFGKLRIAISTALLCL